MPAKPRLNSPEDDLAFMRAIVEGGGSPPMTTPNFTNQGQVSFTTRICPTITSGRWIM